MTAQTKTVLKTYFETDDIPTEAQFVDLIDSLMTVAVVDNMTWTNDDSNTVGTDANRPSIVYSHELRLGKAGNGNASTPGALGATNFEVMTGYFGEKIRVGTAVDALGGKGLTWTHYLGTTTFTIVVGNSGTAIARHSSGGIVTFPTSVTSYLVCTAGFGFDAPVNGSTTSPNFKLATGMGLFRSNVGITRLSAACGSIEVMSWETDGTVNFTVDHASTPANTNTAAPDSWMKIKRAGTVYHIPLYS